MSSWRPVHVTGLGAIGPFGIGVKTLADWFAEGQPSLAGPIQQLREPWLPFEKACEVPAWKPRDHLPDRKSIKLMTRRVQLGVAAALEAWGQPGTDGHLPPPHRRAMYTGCSVPADEDWTFRMPIEESIVQGDFSMKRFAEHGQEYLNPLWLVKSLTNNVLAFSAKTLDLQGANNNFEGDAAGALVAIAEAARAVAEGRTDLALAGAADSLISVEALLNLARHEGFSPSWNFLPGEAAAFARIGGSGPSLTSILGFGSATCPLPNSGEPTCSIELPEDIDHGVRVARKRAWAEAEIAGRTTPSLRLLGPRLDFDVAAPCPEQRPSDRLGDCAAAGGALLLCIAEAALRQEGDDGLVELVAAGPGGEVEVMLVGNR